MLMFAAFVQGIQGRCFDRLGDHVRRSDGAGRIVWMSAPVLSFDKNDDKKLAITLAGEWLLGADLPAPDPVLDELRHAPKPAVVTFETGDLGEWDTGLITALVAIHRGAAANGVDVEDAGLPEGARRLVALAFAVPEREGARRAAVDTSFLGHIGEGVISIVGNASELFEFTGRLVQSFGRFARGTATYLRSDVRLYIQEAGADAFADRQPDHVSDRHDLRLRRHDAVRAFGAGIYTADLVAVAMIREMSPIMTAIIMAGRTGASYAAEIGTMKVNEEIDALTTLGINPIDFLVTPRMLALVLMLPLLTMYGSLMGILGGTIVGLAMLDVSFVQYIRPDRSMPST